MTTIAWDGVTLCGDKQLTGAYNTATMTKIYRLKNGLGLVGFAGRADQLAHLLQWCEDGFIPCDYPEFQTNADSNTPILHISIQGKILRYDSTPYPYLIEDKFHAIGTGTDFALAGMHLGLNSREAVDLAAHFNPDTGKETDCIMLKQFHSDGIAL